MSNDTFQIISRDSTRVSTSLILRRLDESLILRRPHESHERIKRLEERHERLDERHERLERLERFKRLDERLRRLGILAVKPIKQQASESEPSIIQEKTKLDGSESPMGDIKMDDIAQNIPRAIEKAKDLDDIEASLSKYNDSEVLGEVSAEFNSFSRIPSHSHEEARWQSLRNLLSKFGIGERPLDDGKKRVKWRCGCGRNLYDDFTELRSGAAAELEKWLNDSMRKHTGSSASNSPQSPTSTSAVSPNAGSSGYQQTAESDISLQSLDTSTNILSASNMNAAVSIDVNLEKCWLIVCGNMKRGPDVLLKQMNLSSTPSDKSLFDEMKGVYSNFRRSWTLRSVLRGIRTIRFVQVGPSI